MTDLINQIRDFLLTDPQLSQKMERIELTDGQVLFERGDPDTAFYLIESGQIRIYTCDHNGQEVSFNTLGTGQTLGELSLINGRAPAINTVSVGSSVLLRLSQDDFWHRVHISPELSRWIIQILSQRTNYLLAYIANIRDWTQQIITGKYDCVINSIEEMKLESDRFDQSYFSITLLVAVTESLKRMVQTVLQIKESQLQQRAKFKFEIDKHKHQQQVEEIVNAEYFSYLVELAERRNTVSNTQKSRKSKDKVLSYKKLRTKQVSKHNSRQNVGNEQKGLTMNEQQKQGIMETAVKRAEFETKLITKAIEDEDFRRALVNNPKAIYTQEAGTPLPDSLSIEIVEETANKVYLRIPSKSIEAELEEELSDEALEALAGAGWLIINKTGKGWFVLASK